MWIARSSQKEQRIVAQIAIQVAREVNVLPYTQMPWSQVVSDDEDHENDDADSESHKLLKKPQQYFLSEDMPYSKKWNDSAILGFRFSAGRPIMRTLSRGSSSISSKNLNQSEYLENFHRESDPETC
jgi:hypothetical protein